MTREEFIRKYGQTAIDSTQGTTLFPSVKMAQAMIESANGNGVPEASTLAKVYKNFFGIKADSSWKGKVVNLNTREVFNGKDEIINDGFRVYPGALDSFRDHTAFLEENPRYTAGGVFSATTPEAQARALQASGYATDPNYAKTIISLINKHGLKELDKKKAS